MDNDCVHAIACPRCHGSGLIHRAYRHPPCNDNAEEFAPDNADEPHTFEEMEDAEGTLLDRCSACGVQAVDHAVAQREDDA